jgi:hypothetical protein
MTQWFQIQSTVARIWSRIDQIWSGAADSGKPVSQQLLHAKISARHHL